MALDERAVSVIDAVCDTALDDALWPVALQHFVGLSGSEAAGARSCQPVTKSPCRGACNPASYRHMNWTEIPGGA